MTALSEVRATLSEVRAAPPVRAASRRPLLFALLLLTASITGYALFLDCFPPSMADMLVYRAEGQAVASGHNLYGFRVTQWHLPATYPPFAALLFLPAAWLSVGALRAAFTVGNLALLTALAHLSIRFAGRPESGRRPELLMGAVALGLWLEPVFQTFVYGQINIALVVLVLWDLCRRDGVRGKGLVIGIAAGIKLTPAIFAVYLALTGRTREAARAAGGFVATVLLAVAVLPGASVDFWTTRLYETDRVGLVWIIDNQSLQGLIARLLHTPDPGAVWAVAAVVVGVVGLAIAARAARHGFEAWGVLCTAVTALLVSPISWSHHWVWCVPLLAVLAAYSRGIAWRRAAVAAVAVLFTARSMWLVPHQGDLDLHIPWWLQPAASAYPLAGLAFLAVTAVVGSGSGSGPVRRRVPLRRFAS